MPDVIPDDIDDTLELEEELLNENAGFRPIYGSVEGANRYWSEQLGGQVWEITSEPDKLKALTSATRAIDNLNFNGTKNEPDQPLEFPRNGAEQVPQNIQYATYEEALALLNGVDPDTEAGNLRVTSRGFGSVRVNYDDRTAPHHVVAGIASYKAWQLLLPLIKPRLTLKLRRES